MLKDKVDEVSQYTRGSQWIQIPKLAKRLISFKIYAIVKEMITLEKELEEQKGTL